MENYSLKMEEYKNQVIDLTNQSELPIGAIYYIIKDLYKELESLYNKQVQQEYFMRQQQENEKKEE